jgi:hypothetical protein
MPNDVYYMAFGVQLTRAIKNEQRGVIPNFTMFPVKNYCKKSESLKHQNLKRLQNHLRVLMDI